MKSYTIPIPNSLLQTNSLNREYKTEGATNAVTYAVYSEAPANETVEIKATELQLYDGFVQYEAGVSQSFAETVNDYYSLVPENVRNHFQNSGWSIIVSGTSLATRFGYDSTLALYYPSNKTIYIDNRDVSKTAVIHEMGHYLHYYLVSEDRSLYGDLTSIYNAESEAFADNFSTHANNYRSELEYFAESFEFYILNGESLAIACPQTYALISDCISLVQGQ